MYELKETAWCHWKRVTVKAWQSLSRWLTKPFPPSPRTHRISAGRRMLVKYVTVLLCHQLIPNPYLTKNKSCCTVFNFRAFLCINSSI